MLPGPATRYAQPLEQTKFLVDAAEVKKLDGSDWSERFISILEHFAKETLSIIAPSQDSFGKMNHMFWIDFLIFLFACMAAGLTGSLFPRKVVLRFK